MARALLELARALSKIARALSKIARSLSKMARALSKLARALFERRAVNFEKRTVNFEKRAVNFEKRAVIFEKRTVNSAHRHVQPHSAPAADSGGRSSTNASFRGDLNTPFTTSTPLCRLRPSVRTDLVPAADGAVLLRDCARGGEHAQSGLQ